MKLRVITDIFRELGLNDTSILSVYRTAGLDLPESIDLESISEKELK